MIEVRRREDRGKTKLDWLLSEHTFSFGQYHDPRFSGFRSLRVLNEDWVQPEGGFPMHAHREMEIISYVVDGTLEHRDALGHHTVLKEHEVQVMSAGQGIQHSEFNPSEIQPVHFFQIWIQPRKAGLTPSYVQKSFPLRERKNRFQCIASPTGQEGSLMVHQDVTLYLGHFEAGQEVRWNIPPGRGVWLQTVQGELSASGVELRPGDGASIEKEKEILFQFQSTSELLLLELQ